MRGSILDMAFVKEGYALFRFPLSYLPPLQDYNRWGRATQAKAWAEFSRPLRAGTGSKVRQAPRPPSQTTVRPTGFEDAHTSACGLDVGLAESGWRLYGTLG